MVPESCRSSPRLDCLLGTSSENWLSPIILGSGPGGLLGATLSCPALALPHPGGYLEPAVAENCDDAEKNHSRQDAPGDDHSPGCHPPASPSTACENTSSPAGSPRPRCRSHRSVSDRHETSRTGEGTPDMPMTGRGSGWGWGRWEGTLEAPASPFVPHLFPHLQKVGTTDTELCTGLALSRRAGLWLPWPGSPVPALPLALLRGALKNPLTSQTAGPKPSVTERHRCQSCL